MIKKTKGILLILIVLLSVILVGCNNLSSSTTTTTESTTESTTTNNIEAKGYYIATVTDTLKATVSPYFGDENPPVGFENMYYSANTPGGKPSDNENSNIWLKVQPKGKYRVYGLDIVGQYSHVESLAGDIYCIHGVKSDLTVSVSTRTMTTANTTQ